MLIRSDKCNQPSRVINFPTFRTVAGAVSDIVTMTSRASWRHWSDIFVSLRTLITHFTHLGLMAAPTLVVMPLLHWLHWLRAPQRISFKLAVLAFRCLRGLAPTYLSDSLRHVADLPGRQRLRSASSVDLAVPQTRLQTVGDRAFCVAAAKTWNSLPPEAGQKWHQWHCRHLNKNLKLIFFHCHFPARNIAPYWCTVTAMLLHLFT